MRRWNGWGEESVRAEVAPRAAALLEAAVGAGRPRPDAVLADVLPRLAPPRLRHAPHLTLDAEARLRHARGQSFPDWIALRAGTIGPVPDAVAFPGDGAQVAAVLAAARAAGARVVPYGGGTSVAGHVNAPSGEAPVLTLSLARLSGLRSLDAHSRLATFGAGTLGPDVEAQLRALGFTLGHFPQSFQYSTLGGWVATRSSGQESLGYGRIERMFAGGTLESPAGRLELPAHPASAAGPDLRQLVLGSEGRLGALTEVTVRVRPLPERDAIRAAFLPAWPQALEAARALAQSGLPLSMLRLSNAGETEMAFALAPRTRAGDGLDAYLRWRGAGEGRCLLLLAAAGSSRQVRSTLRDALGVIRAGGGIAAPAAVGRRWRRNRFHMPYLRNTLWERGYGVDTVETAASWTGLPGLLAALEAALRGGLAGEGERVHAFTHVSHVYPDGASLYTTFVFPLGRDADDDLRRWRGLKDAASRAIVAAGGTISHHHGVGTDHRPYLEAEKGRLGLGVLADAFRRFDPEGLMNPGKLVA